MTKKKRPNVSPDTEYLREKFYNELEHGIAFYKSIVEENFDDFINYSINENDFLKRFDSSLVYDLEGEYSFFYVKCTDELKEYIEDVLADAVMDKIIQYIDTKYLENAQVGVVLDTDSWSFEVFIDGVNFWVIREQNLWRK